tara:strand:+ start:34 stop:630 length:597 start_codon:yes stop_codon:yes gene_type:complete
MITTRIYRNGKQESKVSHIGTTLYTYEVNGYSDSDWYAVCLNEESSDLEHIQFATTRFCSDGFSAEVDATEEVTLKAFKIIEELKYNEILKSETAKVSEVCNGSKVVVAKGKKSKGKSGIVFWIGAPKRFGYNVVRKAGVRFSDNKDADGKYTDVDFVYLHNLEVADLESKIPYAYCKKQAREDAILTLSATLPENFS